MRLSPGSEFTSRFRSGLFVIVLSFFLMALVLAWQAIATESTILGVAVVLIEIIFSGVGFLLVHWFSSDPLRMRWPIVALLVLSVGFHLSLVLAYIDFRACPFGFMFCALAFYGYLAIVAAMAAVLAVAKPPISSVGQ